MQPGGNMEGKEVRFGIANSALYATITTDASCGCVNSMHDSFTPLGGMVPLINIMLGEVVFGGVGAGLYGIIVFVILAVFIAGLMVGRTPEYLGKKIEAYDVKMAMLSVLIFCLLDPGLHRDRGGQPNSAPSSISNPGPTDCQKSSTPTRPVPATTAPLLAGSTEIRSGSTSPLVSPMLLGRFIQHIPILAIAGNLARKKLVPESAGTFPVTTPLFTFLLVIGDPDRQRTHFLPGAEPGPDSRTPADERRKGVLRTS